MDFPLVDGAHMHGKTAGSGDITTVLIHGWAVTSGIWTPVLERWPDGHGSVLALDLRGVGWSHKPTTGYTLAAFGDDIIRVLRSLPGPVTLVGQSMGGQIAQWIAVHAPELVKRLVLVSPVPAGGVPFEDEELAFFRSLAGRHDGMKKVLTSMMVQSPGDEVIDRLVTECATVLPACYLESFDAWRTACFADRLGEILVPTAVIGGGAEQPLNAAVLQAAVVDLIPGATFTLVPGVGHYGQFETPDVFAEVLFAACVG